jgi:dephospho-CoA kinase
MLKIALTGGIATGKSYVLERFRRRGIPCLDADELARGVTASGTEATGAIAARFGPGVLAPDGSVDRGRLAAIVFADPAARRDLEAIVHPGVYRAIAAGLRAFDLIDKAPLAIVDVPLLYETGHTSDFDKVIVTDCPVEIRLSRLRERGMSDAEARQRIGAQWPNEEKAARATFVVRTGGTFQETDRQVDAILSLLSAELASGSG